FQRHKPARFLQESTGGLIMSNIPITATKTADKDKQAITAKPSFIKESPADLIEIMRRDKKAEGGRMAFILARAIGQAFVSKDVEDKDVLVVLA
ncbi:MAG TPA: hypothetical protein PLO23_09930, partial [Alphaproteobacteria bacterium]|nr:hypothetical protein [Alphaproteobacteria bacterium]